MSPLPVRLEVDAVPGIGEVTVSTDLAAVVSRQPDLQDGDVLVVTSKVVSKAEGRVVTGRREDLLASETDRVVARRGPTTIVRTHHGLVMAAAGIDASNTAPGTAVLLPVDPDASARALREAVHALTGRNVAVVVSDTAGRAWRAGQTDIAVGLAGLVALDDHAGRQDPYGNPLAVTAPAVADEVAGAGDLAKGKLGGTPVARVRGLGAYVLAVGDHGPGAVALVRPETEDLFGYGAREAVLRAVHADGARGFGATATADEVVDALRVLLPGEGEVRVEEAGVTLSPAPRGAHDAGRLEARVETVLLAHRWQVAWPADWWVDGPAYGEVATARPRVP